jgi:hypothetical protein
MVGTVAWDGFSRLSGSAGFGSALSGSLSIRKRVGSLGLLTGRTIAGHVGRMETIGCTAAFPYILRGLRRKGLIKI